MASFLLRLEICERRDINYPQIFQIFSVYELKRDAIAPDNWDPSAIDTE